MNIHESINRILESESLIGETFYDVFLNDYPEVQQFFSGVNMQRQAVLLTMALLVMEQYHSSSYPTMARYLADLGTRHEEWGIPPETYPLFRSALLEALKRFHGEDWNEELALRWDIAIEHTTKQMLAGYGNA